MPSLKVLHVNTQFASLGGLEAVLRRHHEDDSRFGLESRFLAYYEPPAIGWPRARFLGFKDRTTIAQARAAQRAALADFPADIAVYHTVWGLPYLADLDRSARRVLMLHSDIPRLDEFLKSRLPLTDAVIGVSQTLVQRARIAAPDFDAERFHLAPYPVVPPSLAPRADRDPNRPLTIGYCGRLVREQKRVERIPELVRHLTRLGVDFRFEILGDGPERAALEAALPDRSRFVFHGRKSGDGYWDVLRSWDVMAFVSDFEGTPISLLEGLAAGVLPLHPKIGSGGDSAAARISEMLVYPPGDLESAAQAVQRLAGLPAEEWRELRRRCAVIVEPHLGDRYLEGFAEFLRKVNTLPIRPKAPFPGRPWPVDHLSFRMLDRISSLRRRLRGGGR